MYIVTVCKQHELAIFYMEFRMYDPFVNKNQMLFFLVECESLTLSIVLDR